MNLFLVEFVSDSNILCPLYEIIWKNVYLLLRIESNFSEYKEKIRFWTG